jgi:hypothetical protein
VEEEEEEEEATSRCPGVDPLSFCAKAEAEGLEKQSERRVTAVVVVCGRVMTWHDMFLISGKIGLQLSLR